jgi:hypothetical protein
MAATGRDVPLVQLTGGDRRRPERRPRPSGRGPGRSGRGHCHGSIPAAGRSGRARHCVCGLGVRVDTWGSVGGRRPPAGRGNLRRGPMRAGSRRSRLAPARARRPPRAGGVRWGDRRRRARTPGSRRSGRAPSGSPSVPVVHCAPSRLPRFLAPRMRPVNVLSGHSDDMARESAVRRRAPPRTAEVNAPRLNSGVRVCGTRVTKTLLLSHVSRGDGSSVTPGNGPGPPRPRRRSPGTGLEIAGAAPGSPRRPSPAAAEVRAGRCNE